MSTGLFAFDPGGKCPKCGCISHCEVDLLSYWCRNCNEIFSVEVKNEPGPRKRS